MKEPPICSSFFYIRSTGGSHYNYVSFITWMLILTVFTIKILMLPMSWWAASRSSLVFTALTSSLCVNVLFIDMWMSKKRAQPDKNWPLQDYMDRLVDLSVNHHTTTRHDISFRFLSWIRQALQSSVRFNDRKCSTLRSVASPKSGPPTAFFVSCPFFSPTV